MGKKSHFLDNLPFKRGRVHCVGVGGIGVSALAELLMMGGYEISGSDTTSCLESFLLRMRGAHIHVGHYVEKLPPGEYTGVITSSAVSWNNVEVVELLRRGVLVLRRGEFLGELCRCYQRPVLVGGSHGKSSISAMLGWILNKCGVDNGLLVGAKYCNGFPRVALGDGDILVSEADESDGTLALLKGHLSIVTNIDYDHVWNEEQRQEQDECFRQYAAQAEHTIYVESANTVRVLGDLPNCRALTQEYIRQLGAMMPEQFAGYEVTNAVTAVAAAEHLGIELKLAIAALKDYPGLERRQCEICELLDRKIVVLEDYAHHPVELAASLNLLRERYPQRDLLVVFQPHRQRRLAHYFEEFVSLLNAEDLQVKVLPVYSAWEPELIDSVDHTDLALRISADGGNAEVWDKNYEARAGELKDIAVNNPRPILIALIGAGDIFQLGIKLSEEFRTFLHGKGDI